MGIPTSEQETTINFIRNEGICSIWTCDSTMITKLDKIYPCFKLHKGADGEAWAKEYRIPKNKLSFRSLSTKPLSHARIEVLQKARESRQNQFISQ